MKIEVPKLWLKASDLSATATEFRILGVQLETNRWDKPCYVCQLLGAKDTYNFTLRRGELAALVKRYGDNSDDWLGKQIKMRCVQVIREGKEIEDVELCG